MKLSNRERSLLIKILPEMGNLDEIKMKDHLIEKILERDEFEIIANENIFFQHLMKSLHAKAALTSELIILFNKLISEKVD